MKCLGGGNYVQPRVGATAQKLLRYALGTAVDLIIVGCSTPEEVRELVEAGQLGPLEDGERAELEAAFEPNASRLAFYRGKR
jgi:aryl-alcohol dehydrogenase-like predicted oxidoreductase